MFKISLLVIFLAVLGHITAFPSIMIGGKEVKVSGVPLFDYVGTRDPNYSWRETGKMHILLLWTSL